VIKHIVMWKLKDPAAAGEGATKTENAQKVKASFEGLNGRIKGMRVLEVGTKITNSPAAYDVALYSEFDTIEDLKNYQSHPAHSKAGEIVGKVAYDRRVVDYEA
jgi:hypothetical protein